MSGSRSETLRINAGILLVAGVVWLILFKEWMGFFLVLGAALIFGLSFRYAAAEAAAESGANAP